MISNDHLVILLITLSSCVLLLIFISPLRPSSTTFHPENFFLPNHAPSYDDSLYKIYNISRQVIAIGCAITSHSNHQRALTTENLVRRMPLLRTLVPSFCHTASSGFEYIFYVSYDIYDECFTKNEYMQAIQDNFNNIVSNSCPQQSNFTLLFIRCHHNKRPAWAQNDAMLQAYLDDVDYFYRVNDDTKMLTPGWTEIFINTLQNFNPPNVGVVGPYHRGGNEDILTYDFVHKSHIDIFGFYYPRVFTDWWADNWISGVYGSTRTVKTPAVRLKHTGEMGTRYQIAKDKDQFLDYQLTKSSEVLDRYLLAKEKNETAKQPKEKRIISMSLWGSKTRYVYGAIRNANLIRVFFPNWTLRIYIEKANIMGLTRYPALEKRIITKLKNLGVEIIMVDYGEISVPPLMWRFLVADDLDVDVFIVRDADDRLTSRHAIVVNDWLKHKEAVHCVRDHPSYRISAMMGNTWGGRPKKMKKKLLKPLREMMQDLKSDFNEDSKFLNKNIWPLFQNSIYCHDSVSCNIWTNSHPFPVYRVGTEHIGQRYDAFDNVNKEDVEALSDTVVNEKCTIVK